MLGTRAILEAIGNFERIQPQKSVGIPIFSMQVCYYGGSASKSNSNLFIAKRKKRVKIGSGVMPKYKEFLSKNSDHLSEL